MLLKKFKLILVPYLLISIPPILLYAAFCFEVYNKQGALDIREDLLQMWIPMALPWIPVLIWLRPRIKLLKMKRDRKRSPDLGVMLVAAFGMMITMMGISFYMEIYCGKLTHLSRISDISTTPTTKYYDLRRCYVDKRHRGLYYSSYTSGRFNSRLNFEIHIVCPLYNTRADVHGEDTSLGIVAPPTPAPNIAGPKIADSIVFTPPATAMRTDSLKDTGMVTLGYGTEAPGEENINVPVAWIGIDFNTSMRNIAGDDTKKKREHEFYYECVKKFEDSNLNTFVYLGRVPDDDHRRLYRKAAANALPTINVARVIILNGNYGNFDSRTGQRGLWIFLTYLIATTIFATIVFLVKFDPEKLSVFEKRTRRYESGTANPVQ